MSQSATSDLVSASTATISISTHEFMPARVYSPQELLHLQLDHLEQSAQGQLGSFVKCDSKTGSTECASYTVSMLAADIHEMCRLHCTGMHKSVHPLQH